MRWTRGNKRCGDRGLASVEYVIVAVAVTVLVGGLATRGDVGQTVTCNVGGLFSQAAGHGAPSCAGDDATTAKPISDENPQDEAGQEPDDVPATDDKKSDDPAVDDGDRRDQERDARGDRRDDARGDRGGDDPEPDGDTDGGNTPESGLGTPVPGTSIPSEPEPPAWTVPDEGAGEHGSEGAGFLDRGKEVLVEAAANALAGKWPAASRNLLHYLDNSGEPLEQDVDDMLDSSDTFQTATDDQLDRLVAGAVEQAKAGGVDGPVTFPVNTPWNGVYISDDQNWFYALGGISFNQTGSITVTPPTTAGGPWTYSSSTHVHIRDRYNWDGGKSTNIGPLNVSDEELAELHRKGLAQEFTAVGTSGEQKNEGEVP